MLEHYLAIVLVALGTYLARFLPLRFKFKIKNLDEYLSYSSAALISALFVTSLISIPVDFEKLFVSVIAVIAVFVSYVRWRNLGLSVLVGVIAHFIISMIIQKSY